MESPELVRSLIQQGDWATSLDVKSAFNHVPVHESLRPYLTFAFKKRFYAYYGMPFGVQHAPKVFTLLMRRAVAAVRERWEARVVAYMDDILLLFRDRTAAGEQTKEIAAFLQALGWTLAEEKCEMEPVQEISFLGWRWNLRDATVMMPPARRRELLSALHGWREDAEKRTRRPIRELAGLIGSLNFLRLQIPEASLHMKALDALKVCSVRKCGWDGRCTPNPGIRGDLLWWTARLTANTPAALSFPPVTATLTTDASPTGWGAVLEDALGQQVAFGMWKGKQEQWTSNAKELSAVRVGLECFTRRGELPDGVTVLIKSDNTTTVGDINRLAAAASLAPTLRLLVSVVQRHKIHLQAVHLPGIKNEEADRLSRLGRTREYYLKEDVYGRAVQGLGFQPEEDAFGATPFLRTSTQPRRLTDALLLDWSEKRLYLHPPPHLLTRTVSKAFKERTQAILIVPVWMGQPWLPLLRDIEAKRLVLGSYEEVMVTTPRFTRAGWRLPPGAVAAVLLGRRTMRERPSSQDY
jgi:ribonuclease HI